jgi:hypothetical protein
LLVRQKKRTFFVGNMVFHLRSDSIGSVIYHVLFIGAISYPN